MNSETSVSKIRVAILRQELTLDVLRQFGTLVPFHAINCPGRHLIPEQLGHQSLVLLVLSLILARYFIVKLVQLVQDVVDRFTSARRLHIRPQILLLFRRSVLRLIVVRRCLINILLLLAADRWQTQVVHDPLVILDVLQKLLLFLALSLVFGELDLLEELALV